jgi:type VI secretion system secreted protein VgrG
MPTSINFDQSSGSTTVNLDQTNRVIALEPSGANQGLTDKTAPRLVAAALSGVEELNAPFRYELDLLGPNTSSEIVHPGDIVGKSVTIRLGTAGGRRRWINGYVVRFGRTGTVGDLARYRATVVPFLWFLSRRRNSRIFHNKTVLEILETILDEHGFSKMTEAGGVSSTEAPIRDYVTQYEETDLAFVNRLLEHHGLHYYFRHIYAESSRAGSHKLIVSDSPDQIWIDQDDAQAITNTANTTLDNVGGTPTTLSEYPLMSGLDTDGFFEATELSDGPTRPPSSSTSTSPMWDWHEDHQIVPWTYSVGDFDACTANLALETFGNRAEKLFQDEDQSAREWYEYGSNFKNRDEGAALQKARCGRGETAREVYSGNTTHVLMRPGHIFGVSTSGTQKPTYRVIKAAFQAKSDFFTTSGAKTPSLSTGTAVVPLLCSFRAVPSAVEVRPEQVTPRPRISGPHSARVVSKKPNSEIDVDRHGRILVRFHWDREEGQCSRRIRVSQMWAGGSLRESNGDGAWGSMHIPHVGDEVLVEFIDGDPDRPVVTGRVYREKESSPIPRDQLRRGEVQDVLPEFATRSIIKDISGNYMMMEEKAGEEQLELYSHLGASKISLGHFKNAPGPFGTDYAGDGGNMSEQSSGINIATEQGLAMQISQNVDTWIGQQWRVRSEGDIYFKSNGSYNTEFDGSNNNMQLGDYSSLTCGVTTSVTIGAAFSMNIGGSFGVTLIESFAALVGMGQDIKVGMLYERWMGTKKSISKGVEVAATDCLLKKTGSIIIEKFKTRNTNAAQQSLGGGALTVIGTPPPPPPPPPPSNRRAQGAAAALVAMVP